MCSECLSQKTVFGVYCSHDVVALDDCCVGSGVGQAEPVSNSSIKKPLVFVCKCKNVYQQDDFKIINFVHEEQLIMLQAYCTVRKY